jgi:hypothetical protein
MTQYNLTSEVTIYNITETVDGEKDYLVNVGDGTHDLHPDEATLTLAITVDGRTGNFAPTEITKYAGVLRGFARTGPVYSTSGASVVIKLLSGNANDTDVDVTVDPIVLSANAVKIGSSTGAADRLRIINENDPVGEMFIDDETVDSTEYSTEFDVDDTTPIGGYDGVVLSPEESFELILVEMLYVTAGPGKIKVRRGWGGTSAETLNDGQKLRVNIVPGWMVTLVEQLMATATPANVLTQSQAALTAQGLSPTVTARIDEAISSRSSHTAAQAGTEAASKILKTPANLIETNASGQVEASNTDAVITSNALVSGNAAILTKLSKKQNSLP